MGCSEHAVEEHEIPAEYFVIFVLPSEEQQQQKKIRRIENQGDLILHFLFIFSIHSVIFHLKVKYYFKVPFLCTLLSKHEELKKLISTEF